VCGFVAHIIYCLIQAKIDRAHELNKIFPR